MIEMRVKMNIAWEKNSPNHFVSLYCQQNCTHYGQNLSISFAGLACLLCRRQSAKASKTFAGAMYNYNFRFQATDS